MKSVRFWSKSIFGMLVLGAMGCGGGGTSTTIAADPVLMYANAVPDSGNLEFFLNDESKAKGIGYLGSSGDFKTQKFIEDADGGYDYSVEDSATGDELERDNVAFARDTATIILAYGLLDYQFDDAKRVQQALIQVDRTAPIGNKARLLIFNALQQPFGTDNLEIDFQTADPNDPLGNGLPQFIKQNLQYGGFNSSASVLPIDSGVKFLQARQSSGGANSSVVVFAQGSFDLAPGRIYLALVSGIVDDPSPAKQPKITMIPLSTK